MVWQVCELLQNYYMLMITAFSTKTILHLNVLTFVELLSLQHNQQQKLNACVAIHSPCTTYRLQEHAHAKSHSTSVTHEHTYRIKPCVCKQISRQCDVFPSYRSYFFIKTPYYALNIKLQGWVMMIRMTSVPSLSHVPVNFTHSPFPFFSSFLCVWTSKQHTLFETPCL